MTTDTRLKEAVAVGDGFTVGGMAKGSGMIHPDLATMLAVVTTDYPLEAGEAIELLRPAVDDSFNAISVDGEPSTNDCVILLANGASEIERTPETTRRSPRHSARSAPTSRARSSPTARASPCSPRSTSPARSTTAQAKAIARRIATSPLVKTALFGHDANWGRVLMAAGSAPWNGGYATIDADRVTLRYNGTVVLDAGRADRRRARRLRPELHDRPRPRPRRGPRRLPDERPLLRLRPHQRGLPDMSRLVVKVGGAVAGRSADAVLELARERRGLRRPRRRAADLRRDGARRDPGRVRRRPPGHDARGDRDRARVVHGRQRGALRRDRRAGRRSLRRRDRPRGDARCRSSASSARSSRRDLRRGPVARSRTGKIPVVAPIARGEPGRST